jgi:hypothetical protein
MDRQKELDKLLAKLKQADINSNTDVDLILSYLEDFLARPGSFGGGSKKLVEFNIENDANTFSRTFILKWKQRMEEIENI